MLAFCAVSCHPWPWKMMEDKTASHLESASFQESPILSRRLPAWMKVGAIAAASALAGGLAAAWFYRNTLNKLRQAESDPDNSDFWIQKDEADRDT
jgi:hypothetical protein